MIALIDSDIIAYRSAASCEKTIEKERVVVEPLDVAIKRVDNLMHSILDATQATSYKAYLTGSGNFRYLVYKLYKANRSDMARPQWLEDCREHLALEWKAIISEGIEADDMIGIEATNQGDNPYTIVSIDKDLLMIPGRHYNFVKDEFTEVSELDGLRHFWYQMIMGDRSDNIPGYDGIMRLKVPKFLQPAVDELYSLETDDDMQRYVFDLYDDKDQFHINKQLLWILREDTRRENNAGEIQ